MEDETFGGIGMFVFIIIIGGCVTNDMIMDERLEDMQWRNYYEEEMREQEEQTTSLSSTPTTSKYSCSYNVYDCKDFRTQEEAQRVYEECGGLSNDVYYLDEDGDGLACEWND